MERGNSRPAMPNAIHTIPVPQGWSVEQAWEAITRGDNLNDPNPDWANIETIDGHYHRLLSLDRHKHI